MNLVNRVKNILLSPASEWPVIEAEPDTVSGIYTKYLIILAAIPAVAGFIGLSLIGMGGFGFSFRVPIVAGLVNMIVGYVLTLALMYGMALVTNALAPTFAGQQNMLSAFKLVAYGATASMLVGILYLLPALSILAIIGALYSLYLFYIGIPVLMKCPKEKALPYTAVLVVLGIVAALVLMAVTAIITPSHGGFGMGSSGEPAISIKTPQGSVNIDTKGLEEMGKRMEAQNKKVEEAQKSGDPAAAMSAAMGALGAMTGAGQREVIPAADLKAALPEAIGDLKRESFESSGGTAVGIKNSQVKASYRNGDASVRLEVTDIGGLGGLAAVAGWANMTGEKEDANGSERTYKQGKRTIRERISKTSKRTEIDMMLANGVMLEARGEGVEPAVVKGALEALNLAKLESFTGK